MEISGVSSSVGFFPQTGKTKAVAPALKFISSQNVFITLFSLLGVSRFFLRSPTSFESLSLFFVLSPLMWFSHPVAKSVEPQLSDHSPHTGHCPLPLPVIVVSFPRWCSLLPLLFLSWRGKRWRGMGLVERQKKERGREAVRERICQNSSKTLGEAEKAAGSCS